MFSVKQIETFYWVAKLGTVQRAADALSITQSAATKRLQELEGISIDPLFLLADRRKKVLSPLGRDLLLQIEPMLLGLREMELVTAEVSTVNKIMLRIGFVDHSCVALFGVYYWQLKLSLPTSEITFRFSTALEISVLINSGELDVAVTNLVVHSCIQEEIGRIQPHWVASRNLLQGNELASIDDIAGFPIIVPDRHSALSHACMEALGNSAALPNFVCKGASVEEVVELTKLGVGVACLPNDVVDAAFIDNRYVTAAGWPPLQAISYRLTLSNSIHPEAQKILIGMLEK
jgi:DNA-binding transcriptional LysR family regulator